MKVHRKAIKKSFFSDKMKHNYFILEEKMKTMKYLTILAVLLMALSFALTACSGGNVPEDTTATEGQTTAPVTEAPETEAPETEAPETEAPHEHVWSEWSTDQVATCTEKGSEKRTCACGASRSRELATLEHQYVSGHCEKCGAKVPSQGLGFIPQGAGTCYVSGIGTCTDADVVIPAVSPSGDSVTSIGEEAFYNCTSLTSIEIPDSVTSIGDKAFSGCESLMSITVDEDNEIYHSEGNCLIETASKTLISGCMNSVIPSDGSVTSIGDSAFSGCSGLTSIVIPDSVTSIGDYAFYGCNNLIQIENGVSYVDKWVIDCDEQTTNVTLRADTVGIGDNA
ncbi:MAG: leucine-rich repeat domain-containing protein, partial [Clostridia bacterium]|nr:leucine-rich repeat domain-containing protein [Clostridia bacterium]